MTDKKYILLIALVSVTVGFLIHFPELLSLSDGNGGQPMFPLLSPTDVLFEAGYAVFSLALLFALNSRLFGFHHPWVHIPWWKVLLSFLLTWVVSKWLGEAFVLLHHHFNVPAIDTTVHHYLHPMRDFMMSLVVTVTCYISYLIGQRQRMLVQNGELQAENARQQYLALKSQLNPHTLFNSLNTLQSLVMESPDKAQEYIRQLSLVLRYNLQEEEKHLVTLRREMESAQAYIYLMQVRYEENLHFDLQVDPALLDHRLPPMSIQTLIENAIKHNEISHRKPLTLHIVTERGEGGTVLRLSNVLQPRRTPSAGNGIGLANLSKRYVLLTGHDIKVSRTEDTFRVILPLMASN